MKIIPTRVATPAALHPPRSFIEAMHHVTESALIVPDGVDEFEIDVDDEILRLEQLSGVSDSSGKNSVHARTFIARIATTCAEVADHGGDRVQMIKAAVIESRTQTCAWRNLARMVALCCATLSENYGVEDSDASSGEVIRWLFGDAGKWASHALH